jgi:DNA-binding MarR family transcriptional regulator
MSKAALRVETESPGAEAPFETRYLEMLALVERLHRLLLDVVKDEFERLGMLDINSVQALLLFNIGDAEVTAGELKTRGYYQGSNVSYNLKKLVEGGYLHHQRSEADRRSVRIRLTDKGRFIHDTVSELFARHAAQLAPDADAGEATLPETLTALRRMERFWSEQIRYIY